MPDWTSCRRFGSPRFCGPATPPPGGGRDGADLAPRHLTAPGRGFPEPRCGNKLEGSQRELIGGGAMAECEVCGNEYDDAFECAIHAVAPECPHCGCKVIGHGVEANGSMYCCAHCARESGVVELQDRA